METFDLYEVWHGLPQDARERFAGIVGTSADYIARHIIHGRKIPRPAMCERISDAVGQLAGIWVDGETVNQWCYRRWRERHEDVAHA